MNLVLLYCTSYQTFRQFVMNSLLIMWPKSTGRFIDEIKSKNITKHEIHRVGNVDPIYNDTDWARDKEKPDEGMQWNYEIPILIIRVTNTESHTSKHKIRFGMLLWILDTPSLFLQNEKYTLVQSTGIHKLHDCRFSTKNIMHTCFHNLAKLQIVSN